MPGFYFTNLLEFFGWEVGFDGRVEGSKMRLWKMRLYGIFNKLFKELGYKEAFEYWIDIFLINFTWILIHRLDGIILLDMGWLVGGIENATFLDFQQFVL